MNSQLVFFPDPPPSARESDPLQYFWFASLFLHRSCTFPTILHVATYKPLLTISQSLLFVPFVLRLCYYYCCLVPVDYRTERKMRSQESAGSVQRLCCRCRCCDGDALQLGQFRTRHSFESNSAVRYAGGAVTLVAGLTYTIRISSCWCASKCVEVRIRKREGRRRMLGARSDVDTTQNRRFLWRFLHL